MAVREVIRIDEDRCDGCGLCVSACAEGAIAIVDGKARLVSDTYCDGLGACLGHCPQGAITVDRIEAAPFDPEAVARHIAERGRGTVPPVVHPPGDAIGHPGSADLHQVAVACPGSRQLSFAPAVPTGDVGVQRSTLRQWPVQLHLLSPTAPYLRDAELVLAADCVAYAMGDFHASYLAGRALAIACPKLDSAQQSYVDKLEAMVDLGGVRAITVMMMEVPCCGGLLQLVRTALSGASRAVPVRAVLVGVRGDVLRDGTVSISATAGVRTLPVR
jgi:NAD-dependent dihydropyrimidine dehydrogenase PreA subunit